MDRRIHPLVVFGIAFLTAFWPIKSWAASTDALPFIPETLDSSLELSQSYEADQETSDSVPDQTSKELDTPTKAVPLLHAQAHVQTEGWLPEDTSTSDSIIVGTIGRSLRLEALRIWVEDHTDGVEGRAHVQDIGWQEWTSSSNNREFGTIGKALRIEALRLRLSSELSSAGYHLYYRLHVQNDGWLSWAHDGELAGTTGYALRVEAVELKLVTDNETAPSEIGIAYRDRGFTARAHISSIGWQDYRAGNSIIIGTTGHALSMEALSIERPGDDRSGEIVYETHVQNIGWQGERRNGQVAGTSGAALNIEALRIKLTGELDDAYDVWYRAHVRDVGWMSWAKNGDCIGTQGLSKGIEAIQIAFTSKGISPTDFGGQASSLPFVNRSSVSLIYRSTLPSGTQDFVSSSAISGTTGRSLPIQSIASRLNGIEGTVRYATHVSDVGWRPEVTNGSDCGGGNVEAIWLALDGEASKFFDLWYRTHVSEIGWLDWSCNGQGAGSTGMGLPIEAYQICLVPKGTAAPGATTKALASRVTGDRELDIILLDIIRNITGTGDDALRKAYDYMKTYRYRTQNELAKGSTPSWEAAYAKQMYYTGSGNCYRFASLMTCIARALGYNVRTIAGSVATRSGESVHGWTEIYINNGTYLLDPNLERANGRNYYLVTYDTSPSIYYQ